MSGTKTNDLFMFMTNQFDGRLDGESVLQLAKDKSKDTLMKEFESPPTYHDWCNFFDVTEFDFSVELDDSDQSAGGSSYGSHGDWYMHKDPLEAFANKPDKQSDKPYKLKKISGNFGKVVDSVSPFFFENCCKKLPFKRAILVKRAFTGQAVAAGDSSAQGYLRLAMTDVTITNVAWTDGDLLEEKIRFKCEEMVITYRKQANRGILGGDIPLLDWKWAAGKKKG